MGNSSDSEQHSEGATDLDCDKQYPREPAIAAPKDLCERLGWSLGGMRVTLEFLPRL